MIRTTIASVLLAVGITGAVLGTIEPINANTPTTAPIAVETWDIENTADYPESRTFDFVTAHVNILMASGWTSTPDDGCECIYPPSK